MEQVQLIEDDNGAFKDYAIRNNAQVRENIRLLNEKISKYEDLRSKVSIIINNFSNCTINYKDLQKELDNVIIANQPLGTEELQNYEEIINNVKSDLNSLNTTCFKKILELEEAISNEKKKFIFYEK